MFAIYSIKVDNLSVNYQGSVALSDVSFSFSRGAIVGIIGPNGAGKSTLMNAMLGLLKPTTGTVAFDGHSLSDIRKTVSYVKQKNDHDLAFPIRVKDVVMMGRYQHQNALKLPTKADRQAVLSALAQVDMQGYANRQISKLSGGQLQRVFIARVIAQDPSLIFLDEPFAAIDASSEQAIMAILKHMQAQGKTIVMVHHDLSKVSEYFDEVLLLNKQVVACGKTPQVFTKDNLMVAYDNPVMSILKDIASPEGATAPQGGRL